MLGVNVRTLHDRHRGSCRAWSDVTDTGSDSTNLLSQHVLDPRRSNKTVVEGMTWLGKTTIVDTQQNQALHTRATVVCEDDWERSHGGLQVWMVKSIASDAVAFGTMMYQKANSGDHEYEARFWRRRQWA
jgi:hypothetical protein